MDTISFLTAILPPIILLIYIYRQDRLEKEPIRLLIRLAVLGGAGIFPALIIGAFAEIPLESLAEDSLAYIIADNLMVGLYEEGVKYAILYLLTWRNRAFDCRFDGIVYAVFVSLGFALCENVCYVASFGIGTGFVRAFTSIPGHASFAVLMGWMYGMAAQKEREAHGSGTGEKWGAFLLPAAAHAVYDFFATIDGWFGMFFLTTLALFIFAFLILRSTANNDAPFRAEDDLNAVWFCRCGTECSGRYCTECGSPRPCRCPSCGWISIYEDFTANFCPNCGRQLGTDAVPPQFSKPGR